MSNAATVDHHDHVVALYRDDDDLIAAVTPFLTGALEIDGAAIVIATASRRRALESALTARGYSIDVLVVEARFQSLDAEEVLSAFMSESGLDPDEFTAAIGPIFAAVAGTAGPIRVFGEMVALLWDGGNVAAALELESRWNELEAEHDFALYCAYSLSSLEHDLGAAKQVCDRHSQVMVLSDTFAASDLLAVSAIDDIARVFAPTPEVVRDVRTFVREVLGVWNEHHLLPQAELVVSELATNAVMHARSPFRVSLSRSLSTIRIEVRDASSDQPVRLSAGSTRGGRGIALVAALSQTWDAEVETDGKTIWATMSRDRQ